MSEVEKLRALLAEAKSWIRVVIPLDPTRAEVAKQSALLTHIDAALAEPMELSYTQDDVNRMTDEMIAVRKEYESLAFKRGAEAMREAAARSCGGEVCSRQIRALPIPEDQG